MSTETRSRTRGKTATPDITIKTTPRGLKHNLSDNRSPHNLGDNRSPHNVSDNRSPHNLSDNRSPHNLSDNRSYRDQDSIDSDDPNNLDDSSQDSVDHASHWSTQSNPRSQTSSFQEETSFSSSFERKKFSPGGSGGKSPQVSRRKTGNIYPDLSPLADQDDESLSRKPLHDHARSNLIYRESNSPYSKPLSPRQDGSYHPTPSPNRPTTNNQQQQNTTETLNLLHICGFCLFIVCVILFLLGNPMMKTEVKPDVMQEKQGRDALVARFDEQFSQILTHFPSQSKQQLRTIKAACKSVMRDIEPVKPGIILLAGNKETSETIECLAKHIAHKANNAYESQAEIIEIKSTELSGDFHTAKEQLENLLRFGFERGRKVAVIHNLEEMHGKAAMLFHAFCDNENAPFKDTVIIFTLHMQTDDVITNEEQVEEYLDRIWTSHLEIDSRSPLMTRIANFIAIVTPEDEETLRANC